MTSDEEFLVGGDELVFLRVSGSGPKHPEVPSVLCRKSPRSAVSILLGPRYPMVLLWGPEALCVYIDGYRPSLGAHEHPRGQLGREILERRTGTSLDCNLKRS